MIFFGIGCVRKEDLRLYKLQSRKLEVARLQTCWERLRAKNGVQTVCTNSVFSVRQKTCHVRFCICFSMQCCMRTLDYASQGNSIVRDCERERDG